VIKSATVAPGGRSALRAYVMLNALQFLPLGLHIPVEILLMQARGLTSTEIGLVIGIAALVTAVLELPTGGLADTIGRRGVLLAGGALTLASFVVFAVAGTLAAFVAGSFVFATGRALQSGPLKAWFIDTVKTTVPEPEHDDVLTRGLALGGTAIGLSLALGAVSGGLLAELVSRV
jgi:MFS family permease